MVALPKPAVVMPVCLTGVTNGYVPARLLFPSTFGNATAVDPAARAFRALAAELRRNGVDPRHVGGYRSYSEQYALFTARYEPVSFAVYVVTPSDRRKLWSANAARFWRKRRNANGTWPATAAVPGTSNHGYGLAIDIAEETDGDAGPESIRPTTVAFLIARAGVYGIGAELDAEPWHWRYYAGDAIPAAVLEYEAGGFNPDVPAPVINLGVRGDNVVAFQNHNNLWCDLKLIVDGYAGPKTIQQVKVFQDKLTVPVTGIWDDTTAAKYRAVLIELHR